MLTIARPSHPQIRENLQDSVPYMGSYEAWCQFTMNTEPVVTEPPATAPLRRGPSHDDGLPADYGACGGRWIVYGEWVEGGKG